MKPGRRMKLVFSFMLLFGVCACHADDEIEINEIDRGESIPHKTRNVQNSTLAVIFENAVHAYLEEDWDGCVAGFNDALHEYVITILPQFIDTIFLIVHSAIHLYEKRTFYNYIGVFYFSC